MRLTKVLRVLAPNPGPFTLDGTNTWVIGEPPAIVLDPGPDDPGHLLSVLDVAGSVGAIVLTHRHLDHSEGASRLAEAAGCPVHAFRPEPGEHPLPDGSWVETPAVRLRVVHTPGHTPDHVALWLEEDRALFTGDAVLGRGTSIVDPPEGDMAAYVRSLERMRDLGPRTVYPGHGPVAFGGGQKLEEYLAHRAQREAQVVEALEAGKATPEEMVPDIYGGEVAEDMFPAAARSVLAHLIKLEREGRAARSGQPGSVRFRPTTPRPCSRCGRPAMPGSKFCGRCAVSALQEGP